MVSTLTEFATKLRSEKVHPIVQTEGSLREVHDAITDTIRQLAHEPSVGLYFVQQHVHKVVPAMVLLKAQMVDNTQEVEYVTQDVRDALNSVRSMKEVGPAVIERMIKTLDSSLPHLASLRRSKSLLSDPSAQQINSPRSQAFSSVEHRADPTQSTSSSLGAQNQSDPPLSNIISAEVLLGKDPSGHSTSEGDYSGYVRTMFGSALQKATSVTATNFAKWNSYNKGSKLENSSADAGGDFHQDIKPGADTEKHPGLYDGSVLGTAFEKPPSLAKTAPDPSTEISTSTENLSLAQEEKGQEVKEISGPSLGRTPSLLAFREVAEFGKPGQYVRALFGPSRQRTGSMDSEGSKVVSADGKKPPSTVDNPLEGWNWFQVPSKALRSFSKQSHREENLKEGSGDLVIHDEDTSGSRSKEEIQQLLDMERASSAAFAEEKAAKLEEWLQDTEEDGRKETN